MTALYVLLQAGAVLLLIAIFGVAIANYALRFERRSGGAPQLAPDPPAKPKLGPYDIVWWQNLQDLGYEFHLVNGEVWRGRIGWHRYPDGIDESHGMPMGAWNKLDAYRRRIEWKEPEILALHAHALVDWSPLERAYQLKLLNGSVWQFNTKSEGLGENNRMAWHRLSSPKDMVFESLDSIHQSLNAHLDKIRATQCAAEAARNVAPGAPNATAYAHNNLLLVQQQGRISGLLLQHSNTCAGCSLRPVSIPGGVCRHCREAQGGI